MIERALSERLDDTIGRFGCDAPGRLSDALTIAIASTSSNVTELSVRTDEDEVSYARHRDRSTILPDSHHGISEALSPRLP